MNIVDGIVGNTFIAIDSEKQAMRCDQIQEEGKLALTVSLKTHIDLEEVFQKL